MFEDAQAKACASKCELEGGTGFSLC